MRIGLDARYLSHGLVGGVHIYVKQLLPALLEQGRDHQFVIFADTKRPFELESLPENATLRLLPWRGALSSVYHDLFMGRAVARERLDMIHFPANYGFAPSGTAKAITLHDAINILPLSQIIRGHRKDLRTMAMMTYLHFCSRTALRNASLLFTQSEYSRREIARIGPFDRDRIVLAPTAPGPDMRRIDDESVLADVRERHGLTKRFALADALKNPAVIARAWRRLSATMRGKYEIVFFSRRPDPLPVVHEAVAEGYARLLVRPSREDVVALFSMADVFLFPSWFEGLGLPLLEAMTVGAPIVASDRGSIPEVVGEAGLICDAEDDAALARHLERVLGDRAEAERLRQLGYERARDYTWPRTAQRILHGYARAAGIA